jgi:hypothetical protein
VVMEDYRRWGPDCFAKFNGMWAILIVDLDRRRVVGSRDRIGGREEGRRIAAEAHSADDPVLPAGAVRGHSRSGGDPGDGHPALTWFETPRQARLLIVMSCNTSKKIGQKVRAKTRIGELHGLTRRDDAAERRSHL